jgi:hypothetical protein
MMWMVEQQTMLIVDEEAAVDLYISLRRLSSNDISLLMFA